MTSSGMQFSVSGTAPHLFGDRVGDFERDVRAALLARGALGTVRIHDAKHRDLPAAERRRRMTPDEARAEIDGILEALSPLPVRTRRMFGGWGLYMEDRFFGVLNDGRLYFRTDDGSRGEYTSRGMQALQPRFRPRGPKTVDRNFEVPQEVRADDDMLRAWAVRAAECTR